MKRTETHELSQMQFRADVVKNTFDEEKRTVEVVWSKGARVRRASFWSDPWNEELGMDVANIRMDRFASGRAPFLNAHDQYRVSSVLGVIDKAWVENGEGRAIVRFSQRDDVKQIVQDIRDGILSNVSVGYRVHKYEDVTENDDKIKTLRAVDWEPMECSLVPVGADPDAQVRSSEAPGNSTNRCEIILRADSAPEQTMEAKMEKEVKKGTETAVRTEADQPVDVKKIQDEAKSAERKRSADIHSLCRSVKLESEFAQRLIDSGVELDSARAQVVDELAKRSEKQETSSAVRVEVTRDAQESLRAGCEEALLSRGHSKYFPETERGREFRSFSLMDFARMFLEEKGIKTRGLSKQEIAGYALGIDQRAGLHGITDFANVLANVANKTLRKAYEYQSKTYLPITREVEVADFKQISRTQLGDAPTLELVPASGEIQYGTIGDGKEVYQVKTYAKIIGINRQVVINDDLDAFTRVPMLYAAAAASLESDLAWGQITSNPTMGDLVALFHADHGNLDTGAAISVASLGTGRKLMRKQTGLDGKKINVTARYLVVPVALETLAEQFVTLIQAQQSSNVNPFQGKLQVIAEPRLDDASATNWYLAGSPEQVDILELAYLQGQKGLYTETRVGFDVDGIEMKARLDVGAKVIDHRGLVKNPN